LAYVKGGYTNARVSAKARLSGVNYSASENLDGWRLGGGAEAALRRFRVRLEYRYSDYGQFIYQGVQTGLKVRRHQVVLGALIDL
jgi:outer membrane immunogenic protein